MSTPKDKPAAPTPTPDVPPRVARVTLMKRYDRSDQYLDKIAKRHGVPTHKDGNKPASRVSYDREPMLRALEEEGLK